MENKSLFRGGVIGAVIAALCCFTPLLVILFGALGVSFMTGYIDYVALPALGLSVMVIIYSLVKRGSAQSS